MKYRLSILYFVLMVVCTKEINAQMMEGKFAFNKTHYELPLPYKVPQKVCKVFIENTHYAIEVIEMIGDGNEIMPVNTLLRFENIYKVRTTQTGKMSIHFIIMYWTKLENGDLVWTDKSKNHQDWIVKNGVNELIIKYKILIPFMFMSPKKLMIRDVPSDKWTEEYSIKVNLSSLND